MKKKILEVLGNILIKSELKIDIPGSKTKYTHTYNILQAVQVIILEKYKEGRHSSVLDEGIRLSDLILPIKNYKWYDKIKV